MLMTILFLLGGILLGWGLGANDSANIFGTAVYTKVIKYGWAVGLTALFVMIGAIMDGERGIKTISEFALSRGIQTPAGAMVTMIGAASTVIVLTILKLPVSTSQALVGALIGAGLFHGIVDFSSTYKFFGAWFLTPVGGMAIAFVLYRLTKLLIEPYLTEFKYYELIVKGGYLVAGIFGAYSLGANNVANAVGIYTGGIGLLTPQSAVLIGGLSIAVGALTFAKPVMSTVGERIVPMSPVAGFVVVLSGSLTVYVYAKIGIPVSSSQAVVGAIIGIGLTTGIRTINFRMLRNIFLGWFATPTAAGLLSLLLHVVFLSPK